MLREGFWSVCLEKGGEKKIGGERSAVRGNPGNLSVESKLTPLATPFVRLLVRVLSGYGEISPPPRSIYFYIQPNAIYFESTQRLFLNTPASIHSRVSFSRACFPLIFSLPLFSPSVRDTGGESFKRSVTSCTRPLINVASKRI